MNDSSARSHGELDLEALARGDPIAAEVLVELCRTNRILVLEPDVFAALRVLFKDRPRARAWEVLLAQLGGVKVDVAALKRTLRTADEEDAKQRDEELDEPQPDQGKDDTQAARLLAIADQHEYFLNNRGEPYVSFELPLDGGGSCRETIKIRSRRSRLILVHEYVSAFGKPPSNTAMSGVLEALEARAVRSRVVYQTFIRHARFNGAVYIDRGTEDGSAYEVDKAGVRVVARPPVRFVRTPEMLPLPEAILPPDPKQGLLKLKEITRFQNERDCVLVVAFMLDALGGEGPYCVSIITGEPGAAKTSLAKVIATLVDPRTNFLLSAPKNKRTVYIAASRRGLVVFNNLSSLEPAISDALCTVTEGGVDSDRALYTDDDEFSIYAKAPVILIAIGNVVAKGDLADRTLKTELAAVPRSERLTEKEFEAKLEEAAPIILGALLCALSVGLRRYDDLDIRDLPRMASFAKFAASCETAFWPAGTFAKAFAESAASASSDILSSDPVAETFQEFMSDKVEWRGTATKLLSELETIIRRPEREAELALAMVKSEAKSGSKIPDKFMTEDERAEEKAKERETARRMAEATANLKEARDHVHTVLDGKWPKAANALSRRLKELGPQLRGAGIHIAWPNSHRDGKALSINNIALKEGSNSETSSPSSTSSPPHADTEESCSNISASDDITDSERGSPLSREYRPQTDPEYRPQAVEPDFLPDEPIQHDTSSESSSPPRPNRPFTEASPKNSGHPFKLRDKGKGFEI